MKKSYKRKMMKAIKIACEDCTASKTDGLRVIRRFEEINNLNFNPYDKLHLYYIRGCADEESLFRKLNRILKKEERDEKV